jgi:hypothetical protein
MEITKEQMLRHHKRLVSLLLDEAFYGHAGRKGKVGGSVAKKAAGAGAGAGDDAEPGRALKKVKGALLLTPDNIHEFADDKKFHRETLGEVFAVDKWEKKLSSKEKSALDDYIGDSEGINVSLRTGKYDADAFDTSGDYLDNHDGEAPDKPVKPNKKDYNLKTEKGQIKYEDAMDDYEMQMDDYKDDMHDYIASKKEYSKGVAVANELASNISSAINKSTTKAPIYVYRGATRSYLQGPIKRGRTFKDNGFTSASINLETARAFKQGGVMLRIRVRKGAKAAYLGNKLNEGESEVLLQRGTRYKIIGKNKMKVGGKTYDVIDVVAKKKLSKVKAIKEQQMLEAAAKEPYIKYAWRAEDIVWEGIEDVLPDEEFEETSQTKRYGSPFRKSFTEATEQLGR